MPVIKAYMRANSGLRLIQDNAPGHHGKRTQKELGNRDYKLINQPAYSPDLNPIKKMWDWMKDYLQNNFPERINYNQLRAAVQEAWDSITVD